MSGTKEGAAKAAATIKKRHGENYYQRIGKIGGERSTGGGFAADVDCNCELIDGDHYKRNCAGKIGGMKSKRGPAKDKENTDE